MLQSGQFPALTQLELARWLSQEQGIKVSNYILLVTPLMLRNPDGHTQAKVGPDGRVYESSAGFSARLRLWGRATPYCMLASGMPSEI